MRKRREVFPCAPMGAKGANICFLCAQKAQKFLCVLMSAKSANFCFSCAQIAQRFFRCIFFKSFWGFFLVILILLGVGGVKKFIPAGCKQTSIQHDILSKFLIAGVDERE